MAPKKGFKHSDEAKKKMCRNHADVSGVNSPNFGKPMSDDHKKKISDAIKGKTHTEETKKKISEANKGKILSEETKRKIGGAQIGKVISEDHKRKISDANKGRNHPMFGKYHSEKTKIKMSKGHADFSGDKNPSWNTNLTDEDRQDRRLLPKYKDWRKAVYERDNYTCQKCYKTGGKLNAHHIEGYSYNKELRTVVENGITLCRACHKDFHRQYGIESNAEKVNEFVINDDKEVIQVG